MTEQALQQYPIKQYPKEDERCEWKELFNIKDVDATDNEAVATEGGCVVVRNGLN